MRKHLKLIRNENGQMLLFVLISSAITIALFIGGVKLYISTIEESQFLFEQLEVETIIQMSQIDLLNMDKTENEEIKTSHHFKYPNGENYLKLSKIKENRYLIKNNIILKNQSEYESFFEIEIDESVQINNI